jgi:deoxyribodipyrimidine photo-lyase
MASSPPPVPPLRIRAANDAPLRRDGAHVLYWMTAARRTGWNFAFQRSVERARMLGRPLLVLEALRVDYPWASLRHHRFALDGMAANRAALEGTGVGYLPYVEPRPGGGRGLLEALAGDACLVVTDESPAFFLPRMVATAAQRLPVRLEAVDSHGLLPLAAADRDFTVAHSFRRFLQKVLPAHLEESPAPDSLAGGPLVAFPGIREEVSARWPPASPELLGGAPGALEALPVHGSVAPVEDRGGTPAARARLERWMRDGLPRYHQDRNSPDRDAASGLSPWLHWGHISPHEIVARIMEREGWNPGRLAPRPHGSREGWWGMSPPAEAFLDELVTWRELGGVTAFRDPAGHDRYASLPAWARATLADHSADPRPHLYDVEAFRAAATHDPLWNAAQRQLLGEGRIHNYLRMLWGKKILEWSASPEEALETMLELNNRYATDGRDPNSVSGISWVLGRYDRGWPERPIYGTVRSMSSDATRRKVELDRYLRRWGGR